jgi:hypothetical protein
MSGCAWETEHVETLERALRCFPRTSTLSTQYPEESWSQDSYGKLTRKKRKQCISDSTLNDQANLLRAFRELRRNTGHGHDYMLQQRSRDEGILQTTTPRKTSVKIMLFFPSTNWISKPTDKWQIFLRTMLTPATQDVTGWKAGHRCNEHKALGGRFDARVST